MKYCWKYDKLSIIGLTLVVVLVLSLVVGGLRLACSAGGGGTTASTARRADPVAAFLEKSLREYTKEKNRSGSDPFLGGFSVMKKGDDPRNSVWIETDRGVIDVGRIVVGFTASYFFRDDSAYAEHFEEPSHWQNKENVPLTTNLSATSEELIQNIAAERKLSVKMNTVIRRFDDGTIGSVSTNWRILIEHGDDNVAIAAAIIRAYCRKVDNPEELEISHGARL